mgnify:CR=1 FL=1
MIIAPIKRRKGRKHQLMSEINITPFVDVMLVLLVIFMVTAPMMISGINVKLPQTAAAPIAGNDEPLTISITEDGKVYLQNIIVENNDLIVKLTAITNEKRDSRILVRGDRNTNYGTIMNVVGMINEAGYSHISLVTQVENKNK